jgi:hypothetical protein
MRLGTLQVINGKCRPESVIAGFNYRFTILTPQLVRMEYTPNGEFEDRPTQVVLNRNFSTPKFSIHETHSQLEIHTDYLSIYYDKKEFSAGGLSVKVRSECSGIYSYMAFSEPVIEGLWGTTRTLDQADGAIPLDAGLQSRIGGFGVLDDSSSLILLDDDWIEPRKQQCMTSIFLVMAMIMWAACTIFFICVVIPHCCHAMHSATGGAVFIHMGTKNTAI